MDNRTSRLITAFNRIDAILRERTDAHDGQGDFSNTLQRFNEVRYFSRSDYWFLMAVGRLRNVIVHEYNDHDFEYAIPTAQTVERLERIVRKLEAPEKLEQRFAQGRVTALTPDQSLDQVLKLVNEKAYSQFPVIREDSIAGLLTENGIARWLSAAVADLSLVDFADITVANILQHEEPRENMRIVSRYTLLDDVRRLFQDSNELEAVVVTQSGVVTEAPLGIVTRADL